MTLTHRQEPLLSQLAMIVTDMAKGEEYYYYYCYYSCNIGLPRLRMSPVAVSQMT